MPTWEQCEVCTQLCQDLTRFYCSMKPNFQEMSLKELRTYVLEHREDEEAFHAMVDRYNVEYLNRTTYPVPNTPEARKQMHRILWQKLKEAGELKEGRDYGDGFEVTG